MELIDESMTEQGLNELIKMADVDKDGRINYEGICSSFGIISIFN
jgi:Ca2+-binding EF-hand superfamily protein